jgi:hypothetical protein
VTRSTSIEAYNTIKDNGLLSKLRWEVYSTIYDYGPLTARQTIKILNKGKQPGDRGSYNSRFAELRTLGVLEEVGKTFCEVTGHKVILWDVTSGLPKKLKKEPTKDQQIKRLQKIIKAIWKHEDCTSRLKVDIKREFI